MLRPFPFFYPRFFEPTDFTVAICPSEASKTSRCASSQNGSDFPSGRPALSGPCPVGTFWPKLSDRHGDETRQCVRVPLKSRQAELRQALPGRWMVQSSPSRTAIVTSLMRALPSRCDPSPLLDDPWGNQLVFPTEREKIGQRILDRKGSEARSRVLRAPDSFLDEYLLSRLPRSGDPPGTRRMRYARQRTGVYVSIS
jgi:hypothetical protein